jgi:arylsulfatase A
MRPLHRWIFPWLLALWFVPLACRAETPPPPPNIIVILFDDLGYGDIGAYGATAIETPQIDKLAANGLVMTDFYAGANVCTPSRAALLTGLYATRVGLATKVMFPHHTGGLDPKHITLAEILKDRGYATAMVGKWHLGNRAPYWPTHQGFDTFFGVPHSNDMSPFPVYKNETVVEAEADQTTLTQRFTNEAISFVGQHKKDPFFLYYAHTMPHVPLYTAKEFRGSSRAGLYGDVVQFIDAEVGRLVDALREWELLDNTLIVITSDNGPWFEGSPGALRGNKGSSLEGGVRVPMIVHWPNKVPAGSRTNAIAMNIDFAATFADIAGRPLTTPTDGKSLRNTWITGAPSPHKYLYLFEGTKLSGVRTQDWKFVVRMFYQKWHVRFDDGQQFNHPGLLFPMKGPDPERYSLALENPTVVKELYDLVLTGRKTLTEPYKDARNAPE